MHTNEEEGEQMTNFEQADYFTDLSLVDDPYPYFEYLRSLGPVRRLPHRNVVAVTGYEEALAVYNDRTTFSSCNAVTGPIPDLPFTPVGSDIGNQIDTYRSQMPMGNQIVTFDGDAHAQTRSLLMLLFTPRRLKDIEEALRRLAEQRIDKFVDKGQCELIADYASPYATQVIASLLGVPEEDSALFSRKLAAAPAQVGATADQAGVIPLDFLFSYFMDYVTERRRKPRNDVMSELAAATYRDGSLPSVTEIVSAAEFLFGAGQDTTVRLLSASLRILGEQPDLQVLLRRQPERIPAFIEETLRISSPVKCNFRLARVATQLGGVDVAPGTTIVIFVGAANRDPRRFERPTEFLLDRPKAREHLAFGRGSHTCAGAALARAEVTMSIARLLERLADIRISEEMHGPPAQRRYCYDPTYLLRGLTRLHLEFTSMQ
jgi:cytochrome P450